MAEAAEKLEAAKRAAQHALRSSAERQVMNVEMNALEFYAAEWAAHCHRLEMQLQNPAAAEQAEVAELLGYAKAFPQRMSVGDTPLVLRATVQLTSDKVCEVPPSALVDVHETLEGEGVHAAAQTRDAPPPKPPPQGCLSSV